MLKIVIDYNEPLGQQGWQTQAHSPPLVRTVIIFSQRDHIKCLLELARRYIVQNLKVFSVDSDMCRHVGFMPVF